MGYWKSAYRARFVHGFGGVHATHKAPNHIAGLIVRDFGQWMYRLGARSVDYKLNGMDDVGPRYTHLDPIQQYRNLELAGPYAPSLTQTAFLSPSAQVIGDVSSGEGCSFWPNSIVRAGAGQVEIGKFTHIMDRATVKDSIGDDNVTSIGSCVVIESGAVVEGAAIGDGARIGAGAIVMPGSIVGDGCYVLPGSVVLQNSDLQADAIYGGYPAELKEGSPTQELEARHKEVEAKTKVMNAAPGPSTNLEKLVDMGLQQDPSNGQANREKPKEDINDIWGSFGLFVNLKKDAELKYE